MMNGYGMMNGFGMTGGFGIFGIIFAVIQLLFWVAIIYLIYKAVKKITLKNSLFHEDKDNSLQILKARYAKGEINEEEYKKMKDVLLG